MKKFFVSLGLIVFLSLPIQANGYCDILETNAERANLKKIAANVSFSTFYEEKDLILFSVRISNLDDRIKVYEEEVDQTIYYGDDLNNPRQYIISDYQPDQTLSFTIFANSSKCIDDEEVLSTNYVIILPFNKYYNDPLCVGLGSYPICQKWAKIDLEREEFEEAIEVIKKEEEKKEIKDDEPTEPFLSLFAFLEENYVYLLIFVVAFSIYRVYNIRKDDFKL